MKPNTLLISCLAVLSALLFPSGAQAQQKNPLRDTRGGKIAPDIANEHYGPHERNVLDLWKAKSDKPAPLVVYIHGGGFRAGSKESVSAALISGLTAKGISVMAINYRFSPEVTFPAHYLDSARSIQYARLHAKEWNLDPKRVGATGGSAGAGTSLWIGFHDDMADLENSDPVQRESTRLRCMAVFGAQSTYDPFVIKEWVGEAAAKHPAFEGFYGLKSEQYDTPAAREMFRRASAINYLSKDDPPVFAFYNEPRGPLPPDAKPGAGIHHINFGLKLKEQMDKLGIECTIRHADEKTDPNQEMIEFFVKHLAGP
ncbi:MAG: alpha/beta hydrolase [Verrucomicrobiaceae bacterium]|nr:alpha/beta hydrolase [Verrucomicrobiaceae bacterium]